MKKIPVALQLYSVREDCKKNLPGTIAAVAAMGYQGVEFAGYYDYRASDLRKMLDDNKVKCVGTHLKIADLEGDVFQKTVEFNKILGNRFLIVSSLPRERQTTLAGWSQSAEVFNQLAEKAAAVDMRVGYHNHWVEFEKMEGQYPWEVLFSKASRDVVMQVDTGNALRVGVDVLPFIEKYPGRCTTVHLKEYSDDPKGAVIGDGKVRWKDVFRVCEAVGGTEWYIVEQETYPYPPLESSRRSLENLRRMGL